MPSAPRRLSASVARRLLMTSDERTGIIEQALGFRPSTHALKAVHVMNDVAQVLVGGAPHDGGDFLARLIRYEHEEEPNSDAELRASAEFGGRFSAAYPLELGRQQTLALRRAARLVLNYDKGVFAPGQGMASPLATHKALLGFEGFRRFGIGAYLVSILTTEGRARMRALFESDADPISQAFRPLITELRLVDRQAGKGAAQLEPTAFDRALGARLSVLLSQPLSKPALLRKFALGAALGLVLKVLGAGRPDGRPLVLALAVDESGQRPLRSAAVASLREGTTALNRRIAGMLAERSTFAELKADKDEPEPVEIQADCSPTEAALLVMGAIRSAPDKIKPQVWWPDDFALSFGRRAGCILPKENKAGWGAHVALPAEFIELLVLMSVRPTEPSHPWRELWRGLRLDLGLVIGANAAADVEALGSTGIDGVSLEKITENAALALQLAVRLGVARRLPDSGAEAGGGL